MIFLLIFLSCFKSFENKGKGLDELLAVYGINKVADTKLNKSSSKEEILSVYKEAFKLAKKDQMALNFILLNLQKYDNGSEVLLAMKDEFNQEFLCTYTFLHIAVYFRNTKLFNTMLPYEDLHKRSEYGGRCSALQLLLILNYQNEEYVIDFLKRINISKEDLDKSGILHIACSLFLTKVVDYLITVNIDVSAPMDFVLTLPIIVPSGHLLEVTDVNNGEKRRVSEANLQEHIMKIINQPNARTYPISSITERLFRMYFASFILDNNGRFIPSIFTLNRTVDMPDSHIIDQILKKSLHVVHKKIVFNNMLEKHNKILDMLVKAGAKEFDDSRMSVLTDKMEFMTRELLEYLMQYRFDINLKELYEEYTVDKAFAEDHKNEATRKIHLSKVVKMEDFLKMLAPYISKKDLKADNIKMYIEVFQIAKDTKTLDMFTRNREIARMLVEFYDVFGLEPNKLVKDKKGKRKTELDAILNKINNCKAEEQKELIEFYELAREFGFKTAEQVKLSQIKEAIEAERKIKETDLANTTKAKQTVKDLSELKIDDKAEKVDDKNERVKDLSYGNLENKRDYTLLSEAEIIENLSFSSNREEVLEIVSQVKFRGSILNRDENIMQLLIRSGFNIDIDLILLAVANNQLRLMKSILNKITVEKIREIKASLSVISLSSIPLASDEMLIALGSLREVFITKKRLEDRKEKDREGKEKLVKHEKKEEKNSKPRVFLYDEKIEQDLIEALKVNKLARHFNQYLNGDNSNVEKVNDTENIWKLKGHGMGTSNQRIYFALINRDIVILLANYKDDDKIEIKVMQSLNRRNAKVRDLKEGYVKLTEFKLHETEEKDGKEDDESDDGCASGTF